MSLIDAAIGPHADVLHVRSLRARVIASNFANSDTPGYRAKDIDFKASLDAMTASRHDGVALARTHVGHQTTNASSASPITTGYRVPHQPAADGNSVEVEVEKSEYMQNALAYEASLRFLDGRFSGLMRALNGDRA